MVEKLLQTPPISSTCSSDIDAILFFYDFQAIQTFL